MLNRLHYSPQAQLDLDEIYDFLAIEKVDVQMASRIVSQILAVAQDIPFHPMRFPLVGPLPLTRDQYRFAAVGSYLIFFRTEGDDIFVDRILNNRRDFAALLGV